MEKNGYQPSEPSLLDQTDSRSYNSFVPPAPPDVPAFLMRLQAALVARKVRFSWKADDERLWLGWSETDALDELSCLSKTDFLRTEISRSLNDSTIWVFCPLVADLDEYLWVRLAEDNQGTLIISFHLAERNPWI